MGDKSGVPDVTDAPGDHPTLQPRLERALAASLLALLRGGSGPGLAAIGGDTERALRDLEERAQAGEREARLVLHAREFFLALPARVDRALAFERAPVVLADGSSLSLDDAERLLARKEERQAHVPLRASMAEAAAKFRQFNIDRSDAAAADDLKAFLGSTTAARDAARDALATLGGEPPESAPSLARALDLPDDSGAFGEARTLALLDGAREAARPEHRVTRVRVPRQLAGLSLVVDGHTGPEARFGWPPLLLRFDRHRRTIEAGCEALATDPILTRAMAAGLLAPVARRARDEERGPADRAGRIAAATLVLRVRVLAALATLDDGTLEDGARDVLSTALGADPGRGAVDDALARPWNLDGGLASRARRELEAVIAAVALRDAFDETFPLRPEAWRAEVTAAASLAPPADTAAAQEKARRWTAGLLGWAGPLL